MVEATPVQRQKEQSDDLLLMDFCCGHPGAKSFSKNKNIRSPGLIFHGMEKRNNNKMYWQRPIH
jgi:hypothetical protein